MTMHTTTKTSGKARAAALVLVALLGLVSGNVAGFKVAQRSKPGLVVVR